MRQCQSRGRRHEPCGSCGEAWPKCGHYWKCLEQEIRHWRSRGFYDPEAGLGPEHLSACVSAELARLAGKAFE